MKKVDREKWLNLSRIPVPLPPPHNLMHHSLCHFCHLAHWSGFDSPCSEDGDLECTHKLDEVNERCMEVWEGMDCWGFRPDGKWNDWVQYIGQRLQGEWPVYPYSGWRKDHDEQTVR